MDRHLKTACRQLLRPLSRLLLRHAVPVHELVALVEDSYVEAAAASEQRNGRSASAARLAQLTGLSEMRVSQVGQGQSGNSDYGLINQASRLLTAWHMDPDFLDPSGASKPLSIAGDHPSFNSLCARYAAHLPADELLADMQQEQAVEQLEDGRLYPVIRYFLHSQASRAGLRMLGVAIGDLASTIDYNLDPDNGASSRVQRMVSTERLDPRMLPRFRALAAERAQALLQNLDEWLMEHEVPEAAGGLRVGLGLYMIEGDLDE